MLYAHFIRYVTPYHFGFLPSVYVLVMVVFASLGRIRGAVSAGRDGVSRKPPVIKLDNISVNYGKVTALSAVSLSVMTGQVHAVLGANGAGKTTCYAPSSA